MRTEVQSSGYLSRFCGSLLFVVRLCYRVEFNPMWTIIVLRLEVETWDVSRGHQHMRVIAAETLGPETEQRIKAIKKQNRRTACTLTKAYIK